MHIERKQRAKIKQVTQGNDKADRFTCAVCELSGATSLSIYAPSFACLNVPSHLESKLEALAAAAPAAAGEGLFSAGVGAAPREAKEAAVLNTVAVAEHVVEEEEAVPNSSARACAELYGARVSDCDHFEVTHGWLARVPMQR